MGGKSWDDASGPTGSGKKFYHNIIPGSQVATEPFYVAVITPVIHYCMGGLECSVDGECIDKQGDPRIVRCRRGSWWCPWQQPLGWQLSLGLRCLWACVRESSSQVHAWRRWEVPDVPEAKLLEGAYCMRTICFLGACIQ